MTTKELKKYKYGLTIVPEKYLNGYVDRENGMSIRDNGSLKTQRSAADHNAAGRDRVIMDDQHRP